MVGPSHDGCRHRWHYFSEEQLYRTEKVKPFYRTHEDYLHKMKSTEVRLPNRFGYNFVCDKCGETKMVQAKPKE